MTTDAQRRKALDSIKPSPYRINIIPSQGVWKVKRENAKRAYKVFEEKEDAIAHAKMLPMMKHPPHQIVVHTADGGIEEVL